MEFSQGSVRVFSKMANSEEVKLKRTKNEIKKLELAAIKKTGATMRMTKKNF